MKECTCGQLEFHGLGRRVVVAGFNGGASSSDGGVLPLCEVGAKAGLLVAVAAQLTDYRDRELFERSVGEPVSQRITALALGYEGLNDDDHLRFDPLLALVGVGMTRRVSSGAASRTEARRGPVPVR